MQKLEGEFAEYYNIRKRRSGAFWGGRYHATMIDSGEYFWNCLKYIDLNMVRARVVKHPAEWRWCGFSELAGLRKRYRILCLDEVVRQTPAENLESFRAAYQGVIQEAAARGGGVRDPIWTQNVAVGGQDYVERMRNRLGVRREALLVEERSSGVWSLRETGDPYGGFPTPRTEAKPTFRRLRS